ncbi:MAG: hypothetical protein FD143_3360 [Ignavibacteria bacterium]|nr:MAG: hypothetical protein FD143_3360 [Ignavibacteria bacterium]
MMAQNSKYQKYPKATYENVVDQIFHEENATSMHIKYVLRDGVPRIGLSEFVQNQDGEWFPGKRHFYMSLNGWTELFKAIEPFNEAVMQGICFPNYKLNLTPFLYFNF